VITIKLQFMIITNLQGYLTRSELTIVGFEPTPELVLLNGYYMCFFHYTHTLVLKIYVERKEI